MGHCDRRAKGAEPAGPRILHPKNPSNFGGLTRGVGRERILAPGTLRPLRGEMPGPKKPKDQNRGSAPRHSDLF